MGIVIYMMDTLRFIAQSNVERMNEIGEQATRVETIGSNQYVVIEN